MIILYLLVSILVLPIYIPLLLLFYILKQIIYTYLKVKYKSKLQLLDSPDTYWTVGENHHNQSYILTILKDKPNGDIIEEIKTIIKENLLKYPEKYIKILSSLHSCLGYPYLLKEIYQAEDFITVIEIDKTPYTSIRDIIYDFGSKPLPLNGKLLWEILVIKAPNQWKENIGLKLNQIPLILRENHTLTDGLSLMNLFANSFGDQIFDLSTYLKNIPKTNKSNLLKFLTNLLIFLLVPGYILVNIKFNKKLWKGSKIVHKQNTVYKTQDNVVNNIKLMKNNIGDVSFTEIIIAAISASLNSYFLKNCIEVPEYCLLLVVFTKDLQPMTVNGIPVLRNQFGMVNFELPIKLISNSMLERLEAIKNKTRPLIKSVVSLIHTFILFNLMGIFPKSVIKILFPMTETVGISNLPGFPKINICNGYEIDDVYFFLPQRDTNGIGFSILTYADRLHIGLTADEASIPSQNHCNDIINDFFIKLYDLNNEININV